MRPLDRTDVRLLAELQSDARLSNKELAARVHLAPSSCLERVRRLAREGVLRGFHADVDAAALGVALQALVAVRLGPHSREEAAAFRQHVESRPEVVAIYQLTGESDYLLQVAVRGVEHLRDFTQDQLKSRKETARVETSLIYEHIRRWPLPSYGASS